MTAWEKFKNDNASREQAVLNDLARAKATFQLRAILAAMEVPDRDCLICGEDHEGNLPRGHETGDGE